MSDPIGMHMGSRGVGPELLQRQGLQDHMLHDQLPPPSTFGLTVRCFLHGHVPHCMGCWNSGMPKLCMALCLRQQDIWPTHARWPCPVLVHVHLCIGRPDLAVALVFASVVRAAAAASGKSRYECQALLCCECLLFQFVATQCLQPHLTSQHALGNDDRLAFPHLSLHL